MIDTHDDSEQFFKDVLQESILKTPSSNFTLQLMLQVAQQNKLRVELKRRLFRQTLLLLSAASISLIIWIYIGVSYFHLLRISKMVYSLSSPLFRTSENIASHVVEIYYFLIPVALLLLVDQLYINFRVKGLR